MHRWPDGHACVHVPQCIASTRRFTSQPSESWPLQSAVIATEHVAIRHVPSAHVVVPAVELHGRLHPLQSVLVRIDRSHPVAGMSSQLL
jgi:hypothetical protein